MTENAAYSNSDYTLINLLLAASGLIAINGPVQ